MKRIIPITLFLLVIWLFNQAHASPATEITIERFLYDGYEFSNEGDEYVKLCNISGSSVDLSNGGTNPWRVGDDESSTGGLEGMYNFPTIAAATVASGNCIIIARAADAFIAQWNMVPDFEFAAVTDNVSVPNMIAVDGGPFYLNNDGDNITLWKYNGATYDLHGVRGVFVDADNSGLETPVLKSIAPFWERLCLVTSCIRRKPQLNLGRFPVKLIIVSLFIHYDSTLRGELLQN